MESKTYQVSNGETKMQLYYPWGERRYPTAASEISSRYRYTGQYEYSELGLYFYQSRWYDAALGRFAQADTIVPLASQGVQALDRYAYVNNSPLNFVDPTGHDVGCSAADPKCAESNALTESAQKDILEALRRAEEEIQDIGTPILEGNSDSSTSECIGMRGGCPYIEDETSIIIGVSVNGNEPALSTTAGVEILILPNGTRAVYSYGGQGSSAGLGANASVYAGVVTNVNTPNEYFGHAATVGFTILAGDVGITAGYFWAPGEAPFTPGNVQGAFIGYAPGANVSVWHTNTYYNLIKIYK